jgi:NADH dehydrogenase
LELQGRSKPFLHIPVWLCRGIAGLLGLTMKYPPLTQYGVTGFINHADLDCSGATHDFGYRPVGVREGVARCFSTVETARPPAMAESRRTT